MPDAIDPLASYVEHLEARARARLHRTTPADRERNLPTLPAGVAALVSSSHERCLDLIVRALAEPLTPEAVAAVGDGLLEDLLNQSGGVIADQVSTQLRKNRRFRQAFGFGHHSSVDPALSEEWVAVLERLGTTKEKERKSTWRRAD